MGGTYAVLADRGVQLTNVCCTDGQLATIVDPTMDEASTRPRLGEVRRTELRQACAILGVSDVRFFGYHDSGMAGTETNNDAHAFFRCNTDEAVGRLVAALRQVRPHVVVTYDGYGGYGHPDHIQAHRITLLAVEAAQHRRMYSDAGPPWLVSKLYYTCFRRGDVQRMIEFALAAGEPHPFDGTSVDELDFLAEDGTVTTSVDVSAGLERRRRALLAHRSQIDGSFPLLTIPPDAERELFSNEHYVLALTRVPVVLPETDLFAGVDVSAA